MLLSEGHFLLLPNGRQSHFSILFSSRYYLGVNDEYFLPFSEGVDIDVFLRCSNGLLSRFLVFQGVTMQG